MSKGLLYLTLGGQGERGGTVEPGEEEKRRLMVGISSMCTNTQREGVKKTESSFSQWYALKGQEAMGTN